MQQALQNSASKSAARIPPQAADRLLASLGLAFNPFSIAINQDSYYETPATRRIMDVILYGVETRKGFLLLNGEVGVGKSSLLLRLMSRLKSRGMVTALVINSLLDKVELLENICADFGLKHRPGLNTSQLLMILHSFFLQQFKHHRNCVILVDEAHHLPDQALESLRMLANLETGGTKLVQVVLSGQPELRQRLLTPRLRQFASRINIATDLPALSRAQTQGYIEFKLAQAGSQIRPSPMALAMLWKSSSGNPRILNLLMERCLYAMVARGEHTIDIRIMRAAIADLEQCQGRILTPVSKHCLKTWTQKALGGIALVLALAGMLALGLHLGQEKLLRGMGNAAMIPAGLFTQSGNDREAPPAASPSADEYAVTVDIFRSQETARQKADALRDIGLNACVLQDVTDQGTFFILELGAGLTREQALAVRNHYRQYYADSVYIEQINSAHGSRDVLYCPR